MLRVENLVVTIGSTPVVDGISFELEPGECLALVGESGSGKTMTANALLGLSPGAVTADVLSIDGRDARGYGERDWRNLRGRSVALVSQDALVALDPLRRVGAEVAEALEVHEGSLTRAQVGARVIQSLQNVAMPDAAARATQYPHELSGGLRQRALIASALVAGPGLLVADEPTTALDATVQAQILDLLGELKAQGLGLLLISHDLTLVARLADRVAVMREGRIVETGAVAEVLGNPRHEYTRVLLAAAPTPRTTFVEGGDTVLEARGLTKRYGARTAVDDVSLSLRAGQTLGIVGESGSGKSTVARLLLALERSDAGEVLLDGEPWSVQAEAQRRARRARIQLIDQDPFGAFDPRWSVERILGESVALSEKVSKQRVLELLHQVGLGEAHLNRRARELSGGQRQRVAIARALARRPGILVCDEPVSALDVSIQAQVLELLSSLQRELGLSMIFISHDLAVIAQMSDRIVVMKDGAVVEQGEASSVLREPRHPFTKLLLET
ncbi:dipeptide ABC transporter ATP-binding protein [Glaciihabitans arcticus]|uniref:dipeptide ABC transporter ATP-binding protein n=1 Tax=Glaciihabitans arcticus TaxID=2668039 RepID=UPI001F0111CC|nr:ABC transporter ATP-binding protein [Glaciihabitans arcticus]